ncbi:ATP-binding protein [Geopsychrobacter electrodiphilus]|uniref:ATP-binding protein n=1 Tax=Geopsychrobacter electrodiphilus TaxID=225196 RepID=UPI000365B30E|nr:ATP-binding protein [Geopsychrobacter electrodiphilus]
MSEMNPQEERLLHALIKIGREFISTVDLDELLTRILTASREVFGFENAIIRLLDTERGLLVTAASYGYEPAAADYEISLGEGIMGVVAQTAAPLLVGDLATAAYVQGISDARSELAVPLLVNDRLIGVFNVESPVADAFTTSDIEPLMTLAGLAAVAIENARLYAELRQADEENRSLNQLNQRILESSGLGIYTLDRELRVSSWNRQMEQSSGVKSTEILGQSLLEKFPALHDEGFDQALLHVLRMGTSESLRLAHRNLKGELRFQKRRLSPLYEADETSGVLVIVEDITEFRRLLEQTIQSEKLVDIGRLTAGIAHEVNNPLAVISYAVQLLQRETVIGPESAELLARIAGETERLKVLTGGLTSFTRQADTRLGPVDLNQVIKDVLLLVHYELLNKQIEVTRSLPPLPVLQADANKLKQVFFNLLINAAQVLPRGGRIQVASGIDAGGRVFATIGDNGPGVAAVIREQIFEPFFTTKVAGEGTGLGLYLCRNILIEHHGSLILEESPEGGALFRLCLPLDPPE